jgi:putative membrane protein
MIQQLLNDKAINMLQQMEIQATIRNFHDSQGRMERIKQSPFPREYATFSFIFVCVFIFFLPLGLLGELDKLDDFGIWLTIPVGMIIGWIFVAMEMISDYCENPFEGLRNDTPMLSICREIEINMLQTIGENDIPDLIKPKNHVLI